MRCRLRYALATIAIVSRANFARKKMEYFPIRVSDLIKQINRDIYLPAIQREFVWSTAKVERLFDSVMDDFPIGSFLFWNLEEANKDEWPVYEFIRDFDEDAPHNPPANLSGVNKDVMLVLDGQQRITSLYIGLRGSFRYFHYRHRKTVLYLNLLKSPIPTEENPEELTYGFEFRESPDVSGPNELWYRVGHILDFPDAEDAKSDMHSQLASLSDAQREMANKLIGRLHSRIHTVQIGNYHREKTQVYDKVLQIFVRANSAGQTLEYSDLLLATATAKWETLDARDEINTFTDALNAIGSRYKFGKDFVLKACLYLSENLPIQYQVKNFTRSNLRTIEKNWEVIKESLTTTVRLIARFGFTEKNVIAPLALLPIAFYIMRRANRGFDTSSEMADATAQTAIRRWFVFATLKNAFGGSSDTTLNRLREILRPIDAQSQFPADDLYASLAISPSFNDSEIARLLTLAYAGRYTNLVLSLLYPDKDWKDAVFHEDHIFPQTAFGVRALKSRGYNDEKIKRYTSLFNTLPNLELLTDSENLKKNATPFDQWIATRDEAFRGRHRIPHMADYGIDHFEEFFQGRASLVAEQLKALA
jgi:hypothetical protein